MSRNFGLRGRHAGLARAFDLSAWAYFLDFALVPVTAIALLVGATFIGNSFVLIAAIAACGFIVWTLAEYWIHRAVFHGATPFEPMHDMHHRLPKDMIGLASWSTFSAFGALLVIVSILAGFGSASAFTAGFMLGYLAYCTIHVVMHHGNRARFGRYVAFMFRHHAGHHRGGQGNFGVSSPIWDVVFRTYHHTHRSQS